MYFYVRRKFAEGALLTQTLFAQQDEVLARLYLKEERDEQTRRWTRVARLRPHVHYPAEMPPPLMEAIVLHVDGIWTVTGTEKLNEGTCSQRFVVQSWFMRPLTAREEIELEDRYARELLARLPDHVRPD